MILILGGTTEARQLAEAAKAAGLDVTVSLAGRTANPVVGTRMRVGGFGGASAQADYLTQNHVRVVVDATHPFAAQISRNTVEACQLADVSLVTLVRPGWEDHPLASGWHWVRDHEHASRKAAELGRRVLLTVGRQHTPDYFDALRDRFVLARVAEPPSVPLPNGWQLLKSVGPFAAQDERTLFREYEIDVLVTKDSGGVATESKLWVADELGVSVVCVSRPEQARGVVRLTSVAEVLEWLRQAQRAGLRFR